LPSSSRKTSNAFNEKGSVRRNSNGFNENANVRKRSNGFNENVNVSVNAKPSRKRFLVKDDEPKYLSWSSHLLVPSSSPLV
jgi:hypothetical protein